MVMDLFLFDYCWSHYLLHYIRNVVTVFQIFQYHYFYFTWKTLVSALLHWFWFDNFFWKSLANIVGLFFTLGNGDGVTLVLLFDLRRFSVDHFADFVGNVDTFFDVNVDAFFFSHVVTLFLENLLADSAGYNLAGFFRNLLANLFRNLLAVLFAAKQKEL